MKGYIITFLTTLFTLIICSITIFTSCKGPQGEDANETCIQCHNDGTTLLARQLQAANSVHLTGGNFERNSSDCAPCHTHEGFVERILTGDDTSSVPKDPTAITCRTCHMIHINYDSTDWALRSTEPVTLWTNNEILDLGKSNLCANCHQPRVINPLPVSNGANITLTSSRWGPHHSPQASLFAGKAGYEYTGVSYTSSAHSAMLPDACITCHMADPYGAQAGGHTFNMTYESHGNTEFNLTGCFNGGCHSSGEEALIEKIEITQEEIEGLIDDLYLELVDADVIDTSNGGSVLKTPVTLPPDIAGAYLNYITIEEDRSLGIHNYHYIKELLESSIEALQ
ncbi:MAG: hypothetical protein JXB17_01480 [Bacteroidales bacterium]|nr:hypothetical protein [Bacteroidales bacterium]